jgi:hypothetical protein
MTGYPFANPAQYWTDLQNSLVAAETAAPASLVLTQWPYPTQAQWEAAWVAAGHTLPIPARTRLYWRDDHQWRGEFTVAEGDRYAIVAPCLNPTVIAGCAYANDGSLQAFTSNASRPYGNESIPQLPYTLFSYTKPTEPKQWLSWLKGGTTGVFPIARTGEISGAALYSYTPGDVPLEKRLVSRRGTNVAITSVSETADAYIQGDEYYALFRSGMTQEGAMSAATMAIYNAYVHLALSYQPTVLGARYSWVAAGQSVAGAGQAFSVTVWLANLTSTPVDIVISYITNTTVTHGTLSITVPANAPLTKYVLSGTTTGPSSGNPTIRYTFNTVLASGGIVIWNHSACLGSADNLANYEAGPTLRGDGTFDTLGSWTAPALTNLTAYRKVSVIPVLQKTNSVTRLIPVIFREDTGAAGDLAYGVRAYAPILGIYNNTLVIQCDPANQIRINTTTGIGSVFNLVSTPAVALNNSTGDLYYDKADGYVYKVTFDGLTETPTGLRGQPKLVYNNKVYIQPRTVNLSTDQLPILVYNPTSGLQEVYASPYPKFDAVRLEFLKALQPLPETAYRSGSAALPEAGMLPLVTPIPVRLQKHPTLNEFLATFSQGDSAVTAIISEEETTGRVRQITPAAVPYPDWWVLFDARFDTPTASLSLALDAFSHYHHEVLAIWLDNLTSAADTIKIQFNGDTGANYWYELKLGKAAAVTNSESVTGTYIPLPSSNTDYPGSRLLLLPLFQKNNSYKTGIILGGVNAALTTTNLTANLGNFGWMSNFPITSIDISLVGATTFSIGGRVTMAVLKTRGRYNNNDIHTPAMA